MTQNPEPTRPPTLRLTRRWKPLRPHDEQNRLYFSPARFKMVVAGRRSGKTEVAKRNLVAQLWDCARNPRPWDDPRFFAAAPTRDQAKKIWWRDLLALIPPSWVAEVSKSDLVVRTHWGAELHVVGLNVPDRIEGVSWDGGVVDEYATCLPGIFDANIRPALADRGGWMWFVGVPDLAAKGQVWYEKMVTYCRSGVDPDWAAFSWPSADILPASEVESARRTMDPRMFQQEMLGKFILAGGRAFPDFEHLPEYPVLDPDGKQLIGPDGRPLMRPGKHVRPCAYDRSLPLCWSLDFNIADGKPACSGVLQYDAQGRIRIIHEFAVNGVSTDVIADVFLEEAERRRWDLTRLQVYGDATGSARDSTSGYSDWYILKNRFKNVSGGKVKFRVPKDSPSIKDTVAAVNARILNHKGEVRLTIDPSLLREAGREGGDAGGIINDLRSALWPGDMEPQHSVSWFRYFCDYEFPIRVERADNGHQGRPTSAAYFPGQPMPRL